MRPKETHFKELEEEEEDEEEQLDEEKPWELGFERGEALANKEMVEEDWEDEDLYE